MLMNQNHVLPEPGHVEFMQCSALIAKVVILQDDRFNEQDIAVARHLIEFQWKNPNVRTFLQVIAGHNHPGESQDLAYAALTRIL